MRSEQKHINSNRMNWINVSDLKGWNGIAVKDYFIYATPTMFLVDKQKKIIKKPLTIEELIGNFWVHAWNCCVCLFGPQCSISIFSVISKQCCERYLSMILLRILYLVKKRWAVKKVILFFAACEGIQLRRRQMAWKCREEYNRCCVPGIPSYKYR